jgi:phage terminase Nu1 subunit (DNA packaging protein)
MKNDPTGRITQAELARRLNVSRPSVCRAVKAGRITPDEEGLFDPVEAELQWLANSRPKTPAGGGKTKGAHGGYAQARARKEHALARMAELRLEQATGRLAEREALEFVLKDHAATLAGLLENLPGRLAPQLLALRDHAAIVRFLDDAFFQLQHDLADNLERRMEELDPEGAG